MDDALNKTLVDEPGLSDDDRQRLDALLERLVYANEHYVGYPCSGVFDYSELYPFLRLPLNNVGDPFAKGIYRVNTQDVEREVLRFFAEIFHAPKDTAWGYVTNGGTEGNMYGLYLARELLKDGVVYFSEDTHYSIGKTLRVLGMRNIMIKRGPNGEIDYEDLEETVRIHRDVPPIIVANLGTTMTGAVDRVDRIRDIFDRLAIKQYHIHGDAALAGMILPFVKDPDPFSFADGIHSIAVSGHKMIGSPIPCGVVLALRSQVERIARSVEYIGTLDTTISGSRNGFTPLILWYAMRRLGREGFRRMVVDCLKMADYAIGRFKEAGIEAWRNNNSNTVVFPRPQGELPEKWQIAVFEDIAHIITMPHVTKEKIDGAVADIAELSQ